jgi:S1-C subfamily serine protease
MSYPEVVRVFATTQHPDYDCPWQARSPTSSTGSGVVVGKGEILTGAHVVANATFLQVRKPTSPDKAVARVKRISHDCDLALLEIVDPPDFLDDVEPASIGEIPRLHDEVAVAGYPVGGEEISVTKGVVSRIEVQRYTHSERHLLAVTVDAAINAGNSGGPVFGDGKVVGIAFQKLTGGENIGEMVPPPLIRAFLEGEAAGRPPDVPAFGIATQSLENPQLHRELGLKKGDTGVLVVRVEYGGTAHGALQPRDVLHAIDGVAVANNATILYLGRHRTRFEAALTGKYVGDTIALSITRNRQRLEVTATLRPRVRLVPRPAHDQLPPYFVFGGFVFQPLSEDFLATWNEWWNKAPKEFLFHYYYGFRSNERREIVVITQVLADEINVGYGHLHSESVVTLDGVAPVDMVDFVTRLSNATGVVEIVTSAGGVIMLDAAAVAAATPRILGRYHIVRDRSNSLPGARG